MPFTIIRNDITKLKVDAIVNAANTGLQMGGGVCGAVFAAAGAKKLRAACNALAPIQTGEAVITKGFDLPAKYIIHAAGPVYHDGKRNEEALLRACYINSLNIAAEHGCESVAFPLISSGVYGYPKKEALRVASNAIRDFISDNEIDVSLVVFDKDSVAVSEELLGAVESYIGGHYAEEQYGRSLLPGIKHSQTDARMMNQNIPTPIFLESVREIAPKTTGAQFDDIMENLDEPFSSALLRLIDATGKKDSEIYRGANIDRRLFSKIRGNTDYAPSKPTVIAFAVALQLNLGQTEDLLVRAGFALSRSRKFDVIVEFFIKNKKYDIYEINEVLFKYDQPLLGG